MGSRKTWKTLGCFLLCLVLLAPHSELAEQNADDDETSSSAEDGYRYRDVAASDSFVLGTLKDDVEVDFDDEEEPDGEEEFYLQLRTKDTLNDGHTEIVTVEGTVGEYPTTDTPSADRTKREAGDEIKPTEAKWNFLQDNIALQRKLLSDSQSPSQGEGENNKHAMTATVEESFAKELHDKAVMMLKTKPSRDAAFDILHEAAELGYIPAKEKVLWANLLSSGTLDDMDSTRVALERLAFEGSAEAQTALGFLHATGLGGPQASSGKALLYYTFAALGGSPWARMILGYRYSAGIGVMSSCEKALDFYRSVATVVADELTLSEGSPVQKIRLLDEVESPGQVPGVVDSDLVNYYQLQAEKGDVKAQLTLGQLHYQGIGVRHDSERALNYFLRAADAGDAHAMAFLGKMYLEGSGAAPQNNVTAFQYFKSAAERNNPIGQAGLGLMYLHGRHVDRDFTKAFQYFSLAADKGWVDGHLHLGIMYLSGTGVRRDYKLAVKYLNLAAQVGNTLAIYQLAQMHAAGTGMIRSCETAVELYKSVAECGRWSEKLAQAYDDYKEGRYTEALVKYMLMSEMGYEVAQSNAAYLLDQRKSSLFGRNESQVRALHYWTRAAAQGYAPARVKLGDYYYYGLGTGVDLSAAAMHYRIASDQLRSAQAMFNLAYMHEHGLGMKQDVYLAKRFYDMAAETSVEAKVPVALALSKLSLLLNLHYFKDYDSILPVSLTLNPAALLGPDWDLYFMTALFGLLILVIYLRRQRL